MKNKMVYFLSSANLLLTCFYLFSFNEKKMSGNVDFSDKILKVRGVVIVDSLGIERVIVGAHLPEPNWSYGYRTASRGKGGSVSGVMIFDHEGQERGGYVTDDGYGNAFLTLDSKTQQHLLLLSEPQGGAVIKLWDRGNNNISLDVNSKDASIQLNRNSKKMKLYDEENK